MGIQLFRERIGCGVILFVLACEKAHSPLEAGTVQYLSFQNIAFKCFQELQCPAHADAEGIYAALKAFEVAAFEDTNQGFFATLLKLVTGYPLFFVVFQSIGRKLQSLNVLHQLIVDASICRLKVIAYSFQFALRPANGLALDGGVGIGFFDKGTGATYHDLFQQIEEGYTSFLLLVGTPGNLEVSIEIANARGREITAISASKEIDLIIQVEDVVVDGGCREQNEFFALATNLTTSSVGSQ